MAQHMGESNSSAHHAGPSPAHRRGHRNVAGVGAHQRTNTYAELSQALFQSTHSRAPSGGLPQFPDPYDEGGLDDDGDDPVYDASGHVDVDAAAGRVFWLALLSRVLYLFLFVAMDALFPDYDTSPGLGIDCTGAEQLLPLPGGSPGARGGVPLLSPGLEGLVVWDSVHFVSIAKCGYEFENQHAFFPFVPLAMRLLHNTVLYPFAVVLGSIPAMVLGGLVLSALCFSAAAAVFYRLSVVMTADARLSATAALMFVANPAGAHFSAAYGEAPFTLFSMLGILLTMRSDDPRDHLLAALSFAGATLVRSNGVVNIGYLGWVGLTQMIARRRDAARVAVLGAQTAALCAIAVAPFVLVQAHGYLTYCVDGKLDRPWCQASLPVLYSFVQSHYWENGLFRFWTVGHVPNFITAAPVLLLSLLGIYSWTECSGSRTLTLGLASPDLWRQLPGNTPTHLLRLPRHGQPTTVHSDSVAALLYSDAKEHAGDAPGGDIKVFAPFLDDRMSPFVIHWAFSTAVSLLMMHVEVSTRFLCALPVVYWCAASMVRPWSTGVWAFFLAYCGVGAILFPNFYPWT